MNQIITEDDILSTLNKYFNYKTLRPGQMLIIQKILERKDVLICKEIGFGKSLCYQLSGLMRSGVVIVVSPLLSRIEDKSQRLSAFENIKSAHLNNSIVNNDNPDSVQDLRNVLIRKNKVLEDLRNFCSSGLKFLYVTLEYLMNSSKLKQILKEIYEKNLLQAVVIDEVHRVTQWSHAFRRDYSNLGSLRDLYPNVPIWCFTGPMSKQKLTLIQETLHLRKPYYLLNEPAVVENLSFRVMYKNENFPVSIIVDYIKNFYSNKSGIIYCHNKDNCQILAKELQVNNVRSVPYHSALTDDEKLWLHWINSYGIVVVCVSGSDVDIDMQRVDFVIHATVPTCLDIYIQEAGKAGKNGNNGDCTIFYSNDDCDLNLRPMIESYKEKMKCASTESKKQLAVELKEHRREMFDVVMYAENISVCRQVFLLTRLNEESVAMPCGVCDICEIMRDSFIVDVAHTLRKILMAIWAINRHQKVNSEKTELFQATVDNVVHLLLGNVKKNFTDSRLVSEWFVGSFGLWDQQVLQRFIFILLGNRFALVNQVSNDKCEVFQNMVITAKGKEFVKSNNEFNISFSRKDISFAKWLNVDRIKVQYKMDLESVVTYYILHENNQHILEWYRDYIGNLYEVVPGTWEAFKEIKLKYIKSEKCDFDEDLFTVCLMYHQILRKLNHGASRTNEQSVSQVKDTAELCYGIPRGFY